MNEMSAYARAISEQTVGVIQAIPIGLDISALPVVLDIAGEIEEASNAGRLSPALPRWFNRRIATHAVFLGMLFFSSARILPQVAGQKSAGTSRSFHDNASNITYFYPAEFVPAQPASTEASSDTAKCMQQTLFAYSVAPAYTSSFALSTIDNRCPEILSAAAALGPFTQKQVLRQLKQYGEPTIVQTPTHYVIAGRPAAITVASVIVPASSGKPAQTIYAAKACTLGSIPAKPSKKGAPAEPVSHVLCFDFTTQNSGMLTQMFSFIIQFDNASLEPMFPSSVIRSVSPEMRR